MTDWILVDGDLREGVKLEISPLGRGFAYGYGVFETIRFAMGQPCFFAEHVRRLRQAASEAGMPGPSDDADLREMAERLLSANQASEGVFKIALFADEQPRLTMFIRERGPRRPSQRARLEISPVIRSSKAFTSRHKTLNYLDTVWELMEAKKRGVDELVYLNELGELTESSISNLFFVRDGVLRTPAVECGLLDGIVRAQVIATAEEAGLRVEVGRFALESLVGAEEAMLTNSGRGVSGVAALDVPGKGTVTFASGAAERLQEAFLERERESIGR